MQIITVLIVAALRGMSIAACLGVLAGCTMAYPRPAPADSPQRVAPAAGGVLAVADVSAGEADGALRFTVHRGAAPSAPLAVSYATAAGSATAGADFRPVDGTLSFAAGSTEARVVEVPIVDDSMAEQTEAFTLRLSDAHGVLLAVATGTIVDNDAAGLIVEPAELNVTEGGTATYRVALTAQPRATVTVTPRAPAKLTVRPERLSFDAATWHNGQLVTVTAVRDDDAVADPPVVVAHAASGGGFDNRSAAGVRVIIVEADVATLAIAGMGASEQAGRIGFTVTLSRASAHAVSVEYATETADHDSADAGQDYTPAAGTLRFPAGSTAAQTVAVAVHDDALDESDEQVVMTLRNAAHAILAGGGETVSAQAAIADDDPPPRLRVADVAKTVAADGGTMVFTVSLEPESGRTVMVSYATADVTASAGTHYTPASGTLTFHPGDTTAAIAVAVPGVVNDEDRKFTVSLSAPEGAVLDHATATGTIMAPILPLELASLQVTGGEGEMFPTFDPDVRHYGMRCGSAATLQVNASALGGSVRLTLLRANETDNQVATGSLAASVAAGGGNDVAIELSNGTDTTNYVVHCIAADIPNFNVLERTAGASEGLLFVTLRTGYAIVDYHGVPRFWVAERVRNFRPHAAGPLIDGRQVRYSVMTRGSERLLRVFDADFREIRTATVAGLDNHDSVIGAESFLFIAHSQATRDYSVWDGTLSTAVAVRDSVINEVFFAGVSAGTQVERWNSWDHLKIIPDCQVLRATGEYAHLNSLQVFDGDVIASFRGCAQVVRIKRSDGTWKLKWKLGGSDEPRHENTEYLEIIDDPLGEFCGQHQATVTDYGRNGKEYLVLFDNGNHCLGSRKDDAIITRAVEYDISSGTQAEFKREFRRPDGHGYSPHAGGVTVLGNGNWLIAWGATQEQESNAAVAAITEVDAGGSAVFHMSITRSRSSMGTYRVYHDYEKNVTVPLNLP